MIKIPPQNLTFFQSVYGFLADANRVILKRKLPCCVDASGVKKEVEWSNHAYASGIILQTSRWRCINKILISFKFVKKIWVRNTLKTHLPTCKTLVTRNLWDTNLPVAGRRESAGHQIAGNHGQRNGRCTVVSDIQIHCKSVQTNQLKRMIYCHELFNRRTVLSGVVTANNWHWRRGPRYHKTIRNATVFSWFRLCNRKRLKIQPRKTKWFFLKTFKQSIIYWYNRSWQMLGAKRLTVV
jgi:hypothetical protein